MSRRRDVHDATAARFLDDRGHNATRLAPNGLNPANIMEKAVRERIVNSIFFQDVCFGLNEADIVTRCIQHVRFIGGTTGTTTQTPSPFLCLAFKLLQLEASDEVVREYAGFGGDRFKYLRALACFYWRLTRPGKECYGFLETFLADGRKVRRKDRNGTRVGFLDEFVDELLVRDRVCGTSLFKIPRRRDLEDLDVLEPRVSLLGDVEGLLDDDEEEEDGDGEEKRDGDGERDGGERGKQGSEDGEMMEDEADDDGGRERRKRRRTSEDSER